jgi:O-antigen/teichoic acid export membrane protein
MTAHRKLGGDALVYTVANLLSAGVPFLLLPILTRALTPAQYGEVVSFYMVVAICAAFAGLGLHGAVAVRWMDPLQQKRKRYTGTAVALVGVSVVFTALLNAFVAPHFGLPLSPEMSALAAVVAGSIALQGMRFSVWQSKGRPFPAAVLQISASILNAGLSLTGVLVLELGGEGRIVGAAMASIVISVLSISLLMRAKEAELRPDWEETRSLLRFGIPLIPHALAGALLTNTDRLAVSSILDANALGIYGAATQLGMVLNIVADAAVKAYSPHIYRMLSRGSATAKLRLVAIAYLSAPVWIAAALLIWTGLFLLGPWLLGSRYLDAIGLSLWFLLGGAVSAVYLNIAGLFFFTGRTEWLSTATLVACGLAAIMAAPAVKAFGIDGGGLCYLLAQVALLITAWGLSTRVTPMPWFRPRLALRAFFRRSTLS